MCKREGWACEQEGRVGKPLPRPEVPRKGMTVYQVNVAVNDPNLGDFRSVSFALT